MELARAAEPPSAEATPGAIAEVEAAVVSRPHLSEDAAPVEEAKVEGSAFADKEPQPEESAGSAGPFATVRSRRNTTVPTREDQTFTA